MPNDDSGILSVIPIAQLFNATTFDFQCLTEDSDMVDSSDGRRHRSVIVQCMDGHSVDGTTGGNTSLRASCLSDGS